MPQFDYITFFNQTTWILIVITTFFIFLSKYIIPFLSITLKIREKRFNFYKFSFFNILLSEQSQIFSNLELIYEKSFYYLDLHIFFLIEKIYNLKRYLNIKNEFIFNYFKNLIIDIISLFFFKFKNSQNTFNFFKFVLKNEIRRKIFKFYFHLLSLKVIPIEEIFVDNKTSNPILEEISNKVLNKNKKITIKKSKKKMNHGI